MANANAKLQQMPKLGLAEGQIESQNPDFVFHSDQDQNTQNYLFTKLNWSKNCEHCFPLIV